jgi:hypothetical protein
MKKIFNICTFKPINFIDNIITNKAWEDKENGIKNK